jgi:hypothetical protein
MLNETPHTSSDNVHPMFQIVQALSEPEESCPAPLTQEYCDAQIYARALQALRDVRHLLPCEGVTIVDAVLDFAT